MEIALGALLDPVSGPLVMVAAGGTLVELLDDKRCVLAPSDGNEIRAAIDALRLRPLLDGVRGRAPADLDALVEAAVRLSVLAADLAPVLGEIDINPLVAHPDGCAVLDVLVVGRETPTR